MSSNFPYKTEKVGYEIFYTTHKKIRITSKLSDKEISKLCVV
jgi:hypothetical protein